MESHLIISVGERYYCALPKGPLVEDHVLIIPIEHSPNTLSLPSESETELDRFQNCLKMYHKNRQKEVVFFEWVSKRGTHANLQVLSSAKKISNMLLMVSHRFIHPSCYFISLSKCQLITLFLSVV